MMFHKSNQLKKQTAPSQKAQEKQPAGAILIGIIALLEKHQSLISSTFLIIVHLILGQELATGPKSVYINIRIGQRLCL